MAADDPLWDVSAIDAAESSSSSSESTRLIGAHARTVPANYRAPLRRSQRGSVNSSDGSSEFDRCSRTSPERGQTDDSARASTAATVDATNLRCRFHGIGTEVLAHAKVPDVVHVPARLLNAIQATVPSRKAYGAEVLLRFKLVVARALPAVRAGIAGSVLRTPYMQLGYAGGAGGSDARLTVIDNVADLRSYFSRQPPYPTLEVRLIDAAPLGPAAGGSSAQDTGVGPHLALPRQTWRRESDGFRRKLPRKRARCYCCNERFHEITADGAAHAAYSEYYIRGVRHATMVYREPPAHIGAGRVSALGLGCKTGRNAMRKIKRKEI